MSNTTEYQKAYYWANRERVGRNGWEKGLHLDHVVPLSKGEPDTLNNVKPTHGACNIKKNDSIIYTVEGAY